MSGETNFGHGWVFERTDGTKARCGGPAICEGCQRDYVQKYGKSYPKPEDTFPKLVEGDNSEGGNFHPPTITQAQHPVMEAIAAEIEGVQVMANMHTQEDTARYIRRRLQEVASAFWGDISRQ